MANPQAENGHVDIANEIIEALAHYRIPGEAMQCLWVVFRKTYGWKKVEDEISLSQFSILTGLSRSSTVRGIKWLVTKKILLCYKEVTTYANKYKFNKNFDLWCVSYKKDTTKKVTGVTKKIPQVVTKKKIVPVTLLSHTKDTSTKDTSKDTIPEWIDKSLWDAWLEVRKKKRAPNTEKALSLNIKKLTTWKEQGQDPNAIISRSVENGYQGLFELKEKTNGPHQPGNQSGHPKAEPGKYANLRPGEKACTSDEL